jgi:hypothetical protein
MQELAELSAETRDTALSHFRLLERLNLSLSSIDRCEWSRQTAGFPFLRNVVLAVTPHSALTYTPELRANIAARTERHESVDRCTTLELGFNRERAVHDLQPLIHAD